MAIYIVRHAKAAQGHPDELRELLPEGTNQAERIGRALADAGVTVPRIHHSGLVRARQTAEILASALGSGVELVERPGMSPESDPRATAAWIEAEEEAAGNVMVVSHMPFVDRLVSLLVTGDDAANLVDYKLCAAAKLTPRENHGYRISWLVTPRTASSG